MKTFFYQVVMVTTVASLLVIATGTAYGYPFYTQACSDCHNDGSGSLTPFPDPLNVLIGGSGLLSFDVGSLPAPGGNNMIALTDLTQAGLAASIGGGGDSWTLGTFTKSDEGIGTGDYDLDLEIGLSAILGTYNLNWYLPGSGRIGTFGTFTVNVIPEPSTFALAGLGMIGICAGYMKKRRR